MLLNDNVSIEEVDEDDSIRDGDSQGMEVDPENEILLTDN